ncbi:MULTISPECIES: copper amine oxidase N-terminal domain-containing protein [Paenibacillus]|jgi:hypothetical protein|uniref:copper amine oxidase N-terminal domain-containing protein n=1 Tax=Paenibacillus TaxID=44249 RepID=UPI00096EF17F|nr:copper amine oxidase N-terminal domain-containing protein [Paenibacillus sp. FSL H8-0259]OMF25423.1 hypothetical protein BK132_21160 [Paenibacillus sp. FSL H8-0259]
MKTLRLFMCITVLSMVFGVTSTFASREHPGIYINNDKLDIYANVSSLGTTLVPMRPIFEKYGMSIEWDNVTKTVTATKEGTVIKLTHNSHDGVINGEKVALTQVPTLEPSNNIFYVNLRFVSEALGAAVQWNKTNDDASIYISFPE